MKDVFCFVTTAWRLTGGSDIHDVLVFRSETDESVSLPSKNVTLMPTENSNDLCTIEVKYNPQHNMNVSAIDVICNAKRMEMYSDKEYLCTEEGIFIEELEDGTKLYMLQKTVEPPLKGIMLKMVSLQNKQALFLHSIHITVVPASTAPFSSLVTPTIDLEKVKTMIPDPGHISQGAQSLMSAMESFQKNQSTASQQLNSMAMMMSMFSNLGATQKQPTLSSPNLEKAKKNSNFRDSADGCSDKLCNIQETCNTSEFDSQIKKKKEISQDLIKQKNQTTDIKEQHTNILTKSDKNHKSITSQQSSHQIDSKQIIRKTDNSSFNSTKDEKNGQQQLVPSESIQNMKDLSNSVSNESLASYSSSEDTEVLVISDSKAVAIESNKILTMQDLKQFEKKIMNSITDSEKRIKSSFDERINEFEKNMCKRLDEIMNTALVKSDTFNAGADGNCGHNKPADEEENNLALD